LRRLQLGEAALHHAFDAFPQWKNVTHLGRVRFFGFE
jgi:hypothetical protein